MLPCPLQSRLIATLPLPSRLIATLPLPSGLIPTMPLPSGLIPTMPLPSGLIATLAFQASPTVSRLNSRPRRALASQVFAPCWRACR